MRWIGALLLALCLAGAAQAQQVNLYCNNGATGPSAWQPCVSGNPLAVNASVSASVAGFTPSTSGARATPLTVTTADSSGTLPTGAVVIVSNVGSNPMYCNVNGAAATTSDQPIASGVGNWFAFTIPVGVTTLHCIATGGSTTANMLGGSGLATGSGGGGGGAASTVTANQPTASAFNATVVGTGTFATQSAITAASGAFASGSLAVGAGTDGWNVTLGTKADTAWVSGSGSLIALAKTIATNTGGSIPAGSANIGGVEIFDSGGSNKLSINASGQAAIQAPPASTNRIGYTSDDPCTQLTKTPFTFSTSSGTVQIVAPSGSTQVYICSLAIIGDTPGVKVNLVGGTGATCTTGTPVAAMGSTTAANGMSLAANGGLTFGNGGATVTRTTTAGHGLCIVQSGTTLLAGGGTYIQQ